MDELKNVYGVLALVAPKLAAEHAASLYTSRPGGYATAVSDTSFTKTWMKEPPKNQLEHLERAMKHNRAEAHKIEDMFQELYDMRTAERRAIMAEKGVRAKEKQQMALYKEHCLLVDMAEQILPHTVTTTCKTFLSPHANEIMDWLNLALHRLPASATREHVIDLLHEGMAFMRSKDMGVPPPDPFMDSASSPPPLPLEFAKTDVHSDLDEA